LIKRSLSNAQGYRHWRQLLGFDSTSIRVAVVQMRAPYIDHFYNDRSLPRDWLFQGRGRYKE